MRLQGHGAGGRGRAYLWWGKQKTSRISNRKDMAIVQGINHGILARGVAVVWGGMVRSGCICKSELVGLLMAWMQQA